MEATRPKVKLSESSPRSIFLFLLPYSRLFSPLPLASQSTIRCVTGSSPVSLCSPFHEESSRVPLFLSHHADSCHFGATGARIPEVYSYNSLSPFSRFKLPHSLTDHQTDCTQTEEVTTAPIFSSVSLIFRFWCDSVKNSLLLPLRDLFSHSFALRTFSSSGEPSRLSDAVR